GCGKGGRCREPLTESKGKERVWIFYDLCQFREDLITDCGQLILPLGTLVDQLISVADQPLELSCGLCRRDYTLDQLQFVGDLDSQFQLTVELISQGQSISFVGFEHPCWTALDMHEVDGNIQFLQVLFQSSMVMPSPLHEDKNVFERSQGTKTFNEHAKPFA